MKTGELQNAQDENMEGGVDPKIVQDLRNQIEDQQQTIDKLRQELENQRPATAQSFDWEDEKVGYELQLEQKDVRINALEQEQVQSATMFATEIADLKG